MPDDRTLLFLLLIFLVSLGAAFSLIPRVPTRLHTPLMSLTNAVSAVTLLGAFLIFAVSTTWTETILGGVAVLAAAFNAVGGFVVTHRMLRFFKKR